MAMVVVFVAIGALVAIRMMTEGTSRDLRLQTGTRADLSELVDALVSFTAVQNRLPCPDLDGDGDEDSPCAASQAGGTLPWVSLGLSRRDATDRWGSPILYRVAPEFTAPASATLSATYGATTYAGPAPGLTVCTRLDPATGSIDNCDVEDQLVGPGDGSAPRAAAAFVLVSLGPTAVASPAADGAEEANLRTPGTPPSATTGLVWYDLPFDTHTRDAGGRDVPRDPAADPVHFDDIVLGMSLQDLMERAALLLSPAGATPGPTSGPGTNAMTASTLTAGNNGNEWSVKMKMFGATTDGTTGGVRQVQPRITTDPDGEPQFEFRPVQERVNQDMSACVWSVMDLRLRDSVVRSYFEISFKNDAGNVRGHGATHGFLPLEVSGSRSDQNDGARCGAEGVYLGFATPRGGTGNRGLTDPGTDFLTPLTNYRDAMAFAVELDTSHQRARINSNDFKDPRSSIGTNHIAVDLDNVFHDETLDGESTHQNRDFPNPACGETPSDACSYDAGDANWLEKGDAAFHRVRVEMETGAGSCSPDEVEVKTWIWPPGAACADETTCRDITVPYEENDDDAETLVHCLPLATRTVDAGAGATLHAWDRLRFGFTSGIPSYSNYSDAARSDPIVRRHTIGSFRKWQERPDADATSVSTLVDAALVSQQVNWDLIAKARAQARTFAWTGTSWMPLPDLGVEVSSYLGEITLIRPSDNGNLGNRWGFGVNGIGGDGTFGGATQQGKPPLQNVTDPARRPLLPEMRNRLDFTFDERWKEGRLLLTGFSNYGGAAEQVRLQLWRVGPVPEKVGEAVVPSCQTTSGDSDEAAVLVAFDSPATFDTISVIPEPRTNTGASSLWVRALRGCGASSGTDCTVPETRMPTWWNTCVVNLHADDLD